MGSFSVILVAFLFSVLPAVFARCSHSSHCSSGNPSMIDMCMHSQGLCISLPHPSARQEDVPAEPEVIPTTLERLVNESNAIDFPLAEKIKTIEAIKTIYEGVNPHKFLHENLLGIDFPAALEAIEVTEKTTNVEFYDKMSKTFQLMDDKHSLFVLPYPFNSSVATLGFFPKIFYDKASDTPMKRRYVVTDANDNIIPEDSSFGIGSELLTFNGKPIDDVIVAFGKDSYGSNSAAQIDTAVQTLTLRLLVFEPIPFEPSVEIGYVNPDGKESTVTVEWFFAEIILPELAEALMRQVAIEGRGSFSKKKPRLSFGLRSKEKIRVGPEMHNDYVRAVEEGRIPIPVEPAFEQRFSAEIVNTRNGPVGRFILPDFGSDATPELVAEIARILKQMPDNGLIMDLRGNGGGYPNYVKVLVELLTGKSPPQLPTVIRATQFMKDTLDNMPATSIFATEFNVCAYQGAVDTALKIGEPFAGPSSGLYTGEFVKSPVARAYFGPFITLVDGRCYSAGDIFAALQKDLELSLVVGVSDNVGGGGGYTYLPKDLEEIFSVVLEPITAEFTMALGRFYRSGNKEGTITENFGLEPDVKYYATLDDALKNDCDLFEFLSEKLRELNTGEGMEPEVSPEEETVEEVDGIEPSPEEVI